MSLMRWLPLLLLLTILPFAIGTTRPASPTPPADDESSTFSAERASFSVHVRGEVIPYRVMAIFVMPREQVRLDVKAPGPSAAFTVNAKSGAVQPSGPAAWEWTAPSTPGLYPIAITDAASGERIRLNAFVLTPFDHRNRRLGDYRIGHYKRKPLRDNPVYNRPQGLVRLTPANRDVRVSPHFTLGQFACKQTDGYPQYLLLREQLLLKLELILQTANARGYAVNTLHVMSGFRTPYYNRAIGNRTEYSRHLYGGAADIFIDADKNGYMDDLNRDGDVTKADAHILASMVEDHQHNEKRAPFAGGLGVYGPAPHRGPFVHVDVRGYRARW